MKWILGAFGAAVAFLVMGLFTSTGNSQAPDAAKASRTLTAMGTGTIKVDADAAKITMKIEAGGGDLKTAREALEKNAGRLKEALEGLKLTMEIRALPVEIHLQNNGFGFQPGGFGGGGIGFPGAPNIPNIPPAPMPPRPNPIAPPAVERQANGDFFAAPAPQPLKAPGDPMQQVQVPMNPNPPPVPMIGIGGFQAPQPPQPGFGRGPFQLAQTYVVTIKNSDGAKLVDGVNKTLFAAAENGVVMPNANPNQNNNTPPFGMVGMANQPAKTGPTVRFLKVDDRESRRKALESAVADAIANAKVMAKGADVKVVETLSINDPPASRTGHPIVDLGNGADSVAGEIDIVVRVTVTCSY